MAYDSIKARKAVQTANAYERLPGSEFVMEMAKILKEADEEIAGSSEKIRAAEREAKRYQHEADEAREESKRLKESSGRPFALAIAALQEIAAGGKGAKVRAAAALKEIVPEKPATAGSMFQQSDSPLVGDRIGAIEGQP